MKYTLLFTSIIISVFIMSYAGNPARAAIQREVNEESGDIFRKGVHNGEMAQFIPDEKKDGKTPGKPNSPEKKPMFIMGVGGGVSNLEGMASVSLLTCLGFQQSNYHFSGEPTLHYMRAFSLKPGKGLASMLRTKSSGSVLEFSIPLKFSYSFLDLENHPYSPFISAGAGYSHRRFAYHGSGALARLSSDFYVDALTLNFGFGFMAKINEQSRLQIGINCISYFDTRAGTFTYDTTGASLFLGVILLFY